MPGIPFKMAELDGVGEVVAQRAGGRGHRHLDPRHFALDVEAVDQPQIHDVDAQLGVDDLVEQVERLQWSFAGVRHAGLVEKPVADLHSVAPVCVAALPPGQALFASSPPASIACCKSCVRAARSRL